MQMDFDDAEERHDPTEAEDYCPQQGKSASRRPFIPKL
jgi:hypothetical protein